MRNPIFSACPYIFLGVWCLACGAPATSEPSELAGSSSIQLRVDIPALLQTDDVQTLRFQAQRVSCDGETVQTETVVSETSVSDLLLPVANPELANQPLAPGSQHAFADKLMLLTPGCYDIKLTPLGADGNASLKCASAEQKAVRVLPELTTEIVLVSQCTDDPSNGLIDAVQPLNHPPSIGNLQNQDGRFVATCAPARFCVDASDVDGDPLELTWTAAPGSTRHFASPTVLSSTLSADGTLRQCVGIVPLEKGEFQFTATAYDLATVAGVSTPIETVLAAAGDASSSHASLTFSLVAAGSASCSP